MSLVCVCVCVCVCGGGGGILIILHLINYSTDKSFAQILPLSDHKICLLPSLSKQPN